MAPKRATKAHKRHNGNGAHTSAKMGGEKKEAPENKDDVYEWPADRPYVHPDQGGPATIGGKRVVPPAQPQT